MTKTKPYCMSRHILVDNQKGDTKHYYAESERIASRIGNGGLACIDTPLVALSTYTSKLNTNSDYMDTVAQNRLSAPNYITTNLLDTLYHWKIPHGNTEPDCYWYHPDHLGSASWVTSSNGDVVQYLYYLPWGEDFVSQRSTNWHTMYTFSAKEKDAETGYSYFGSRYYSSDLSIWLSVDPMAHKYPSLSPYTYCANNPIRLVDPNGMEIDEPQRRAAIAKAKEYEYKNRKDETKPSGKGNSQNTYRLGAKGKPGEDVDCSGLTSACIVAGGEKDPVGMFPEEGGGVKQTKRGTTEVTFDEAETGNLVAFNKGTHIGIIIDIQRDEDGKMTGFVMIHSSGDKSRGYSGPNMETVKIGGGYWGTKIDGIFKWDQKPDESTEENNSSLPLQHKCILK